MMCHQWLYMYVRLRSRDVGTQCMYQPPQADNAVTRLLVGK